MEWNPDCIITLSTASCEWAPD